VYSFESTDLIADINTNSGMYNNRIYFPASNWSSNDYIVSKSFLEKLIDAKKFVAKT